MPENDLDINSQSIYINLLTFSWGVNVVRYAIDTRDFIDDLLDVYAALPACLIDLKKQTTGAKDDPISVTLPPVPPVDALLLGVPFPKLTVLIEELDRRDITTRRALFKGFVNKVIGNKNGKEDQVEITVEGLRQRFTGTLGIPANNTCAWAFGDKNCAVDVSLNQVNGITNSASPNSENLITVNHALFLAPVGYWDRGYIEFPNGFKGLIRLHDPDIGVPATASALYLVDRGPSLPIGSNTPVILTPGCDKLLTTCHNKWDNVENFGGFGFAIPAYHPVFESQ